MTSAASEPVVPADPGWGWMAEFASAAALRAAAQAARDAGYAPQAYAPFHVEGLAETLGGARAPIAGITFAGAFLGATLGYAMQWFSAVIDRPLNIGGRPLNSWPMFVPVAFELMILGGALAAVLAFLWASRLPRLRHPVFGAADFEWATRHRFFLVLCADDPVFEAGAAAGWLDAQGPLRRIGVPP
jgi:hypothetical protein